MIITKFFCFCLFQLGIRNVFEPRIAELGPMTPDLGVYARDIQQSIAVNIRNFMSTPNNSTNNATNGAMNNTNSNNSNNNNNTNNNTTSNNNNGNNTSNANNGQQGMPPLILPPRPNSFNFMRPGKNFVEIQELKNIKFRYYHIF